MTLGNWRRTNLGVIQEQDVFNNSKVYHSFSASDGGHREVVCQLSVPRGRQFHICMLNFTYLCIYNEKNGRLKHNHEKKNEFNQSPEERTAGANHVFILREENYWAFHGNPRH